MIAHLEINGIHYYNVAVEDLKNAGVEQSVIDAALNNEKWKTVRDKRNGLISETGSLYQRHSREIRNGKVIDGETNSTTLSSNQIQEIDSYIQTLADIPQIYTNPDDVVWPEKPVL